jgi:hypothetical protein
MIRPGRLDDQECLRSARLRGCALTVVSASLVGLSCAGCALTATRIAQQSSAVSKPGPTQAALPTGAAVPTATAEPSANPATSPTFGAFTSWRAAQTAADFDLLQPASANGLPLVNGGIQVGQCAGDSSHADVVATFAAGAYELTIEQDDEPGPQPCSNIGEAGNLGTYTVDGAQAQLLGACGTASGEPSCGSASLWLFLVWTTGGDRLYQVEAHNKSRTQVIAFAQSLTGVS